MIYMYIWFVWSLVAADIVVRKSDGTLRTEFFIRQRLIFTAYSY